MKTNQRLAQDPDDPFSERPWSGKWFDFLEDQKEEPPVRPKEQPPAPTAQVEVENVVDLPRFKPLVHRPTEFFAAVQEWEGVVKEVGRTSFSADLYDIGDHSGEVNELAEISYEDIDSSDRDKVVPGAIFRWLIGRSRTRSGTTSRKWVIYFRRATPQPSGLSVFRDLKLPAHLRDHLEGSNDAHSGVTI